MVRDQYVAERSSQEAGAADRYRSVFENSLVGVFTVSSRRNIMEINPRACEIFGFPCADAVGRSIADVHVSHEHFLRFGEAVFCQIDAAGVSNIEYRLKRQNGETFWAELSGKPINGRNRDDGVVWAIVDIFAAQTAEAALRESEEGYQLAVAGANDGFCDCEDPDERGLFLAPLEGDHRLP